MKSQAQNYTISLVLKPDEVRHFQDLLRFSGSHFSLFDLSALDVPRKTVSNLTQAFQRLHEPGQEIQISGLQLIGLYKLLGEIRRNIGAIDAEGIHLSESDIDVLDQKIEFAFDAIPRVLKQPSTITFKMGG